MSNIQQKNTDFYITRRQRGNLWFLSLIELIKIMNVLISKEIIIFYKKNIKKNPTKRETLKDDATVFFICFAVSLRLMLHHITWIKYFIVNKGKLSFGHFKILSFASKKNWSKLENKGNVFRCEFNKYVFCKSSNIEWNWIFYDLISRKYIYRVIQEKRFYSLTHSPFPSSLLILAKELAFV